MKLEKKVTVVVVGAILAFTLIAAMAWQTGLVSKTGGTVTLDAIEVQPPTTTPAIEEGWWGEMPTPVSLH